MSGNIGRLRAKVGRSWTNIDRLRTHLGQFRPMLSDTGNMLVGFGRIRGDFGRSAPILADVGRMCPKLGHARQELDRIRCVGRPRVGQHGRGCGQISPMPTGLGPTWAEVGLHAKKSNGPR